MAGFVSRRSADRWNNAARIVEGGGAGNRQVPGMYRTPRVVCDDLMPGVYRATAGATIDPGETGWIVIEECNGTQSIRAENHSNCTFRIGDKITAFVDPCCNVHFTGCATTAPVDCCDKSIAVCMFGVSKIVNINEGFPTQWANAFDPPTPPTGCNLFFTNATIRIDCVGTTLTAYYAFNWGCVVDCGDGIAGVSGTFDWSDLCNDPPTSYEETVKLFTGCSVTINADPELTPCGDEADPTGCCDKSLWFCVNNTSVQLPMVGGNHTFTVTDCCDNCAGVSTLEIDTACNNGIPAVTWKYICNGGTPQIETRTLSEFCSSLAPIRIPVITSFCSVDLHVSFVEIPCDSCIPTVDTLCCSGVPETLEMVIVGGAFAGTYSMTYAAGEWTAQPPATFTGRLTCESGPSWQLVFEMDTYGTATATCDPFQLSMDVTGNGYSITSITISEP